MRNATATKPNSRICQSSKRSVLSHKQLEISRFDETRVAPTWFHPGFFSDSRIVYQPVIVQYIRFITIIMCIERYCQQSNNFTFVRMGNLLYSYRTASFSALVSCRCDSAWMLNNQQIRVTMLCSLSHTVNNFRGSHRAADLACVSSH